MVIVDDSVQSEGPLLSVRYIYDHNKYLLYFCDCNVLICAYNNQLAYSMMLLSPCCNLQSSMRILHILSYDFALYVVG